MEAKDTVVEEKIRAIVEEWIYGARIVVSLVNQISILLATQIEEAKREAFDYYADMVKLAIDRVKKEAKREVARDIFEEIDKHQLPDTPESNPYPGLVVLSKAQYQALKSKWLGNQKMARGVLPADNEPAEDTLDRLRNQSS
jgi:hypothetical protein